MTKTILYLIPLWFVAMMLYSVGHHFTIEPIRNAGLALAMATTFSTLSVLTIGAVHAFRKPRHK